jgi:hypothetical protein
MAAAAAALALLLAAGAAAADPFSAKTSGMAAEGFVERERVEGTDGPLRAAVVVYSPREGGGDRLEFYLAVRGKAYLGYSHPASADRLEIDASPYARAFGDLLGDGSRAIAYRSRVPALGSSTLHILRWKGFKVGEAAAFPEGRLVSLGGKPVIVRRDLPLGRFLSVGCENFGTTSRTAFRTTLHEPRAGRFVDASARHAGWFEDEIDRKERSLRAMSSDLEKNAGDYLGLALSVYYDYAALGRAREGWERQKEFFKVPVMAPPSVKACFAAMRADLRTRLGVPADWP